MWRVILLFPLFTWLLKGVKDAFVATSFDSPIVPFFVDQMSCNQSPPLSKHVAIKYHSTSLCKINTLCKLIQILLLPSVFQYSRRGRIEGECWNYKRMLFLWYCVLGSRRSLFWICDFRSSSLIHFTKSIVLGLFRKPVGNSCIHQLHLPLTRIAGRSNAIKFKLTFGDVKDISFKKGDIVFRTTDYKVFIKYLGTPTTDSLELVFLNPHLCHTNFLFFIFGFFSFNGFLKGIL